MKKKLLGLLLATSVVAASFAGCGNESSSTSASAASATDEAANPEDISGEITFVSANDQTGALDEMIESFNKVYPNVVVNHESLPGASDDIKESLMTSLAAGDSSPDVFECDIIWVSQFAAAGWLADVTEDIEPIADQYLGGPLSTVYYNDRAYAYPDYTDVGLLYYRSDIIDTPPTTWDELVELSNEYVGKDGIEYGYLFQMFQGEPTSCNMLEFIKQNGGQDLVNGEFKLNSSNTVESLEFVEELISSGVSPEGVLTHKPADSRAIFEEGNALFMRNWTSAYALTQTEEGSQVVGKVGVAALPTGPNGSSSSGTLGGWAFAVNAYSEQTEAAKAFAEYMSSYEAQKISALKRGTFPVVADVYDDEEVLSEQPYIAAVKDAADAAEPRPQVRDYSTVSTLFAEYIHKALTGELSNEEALETLDTKLNEALAEMQ
ncbi:multiple sugar transport system substrate-binding protein [Pseudobutyrivibrio ruminis]|uniref:Multiple sugar transport system substrate-binding protein n=1 Tax=Pseudobutyrivibrio ruminis TaxID=46206 RepID=A0A1H7K3P0_9FIRM|nr:ABC transporter substrate-binding protein [Pseudobutyrivibrio ruminis]SEK81050.1 multiple sugar transport system substrate-binding protein [Pseudobutyrivibrio ruminis]